MKTVEEKFRKELNDLLLKWKAVIEVQKCCNYSDHECPIIVELFPICNSDGEIIREAITIDLGEYFEPEIKKD